MVGYLCFKKILNDWKRQNQNNFYTLINNIQPKHMHTTANSKEQRIREFGCNENYRSVIKSWGFTSCEVLIHVASMSCMRTYQWSQFCTPPMILIHHTFLHYAFLYKKLAFFITFIVVYLLPLCLFIMLDVSVYAFLWYHDVMWCNVMCLTSDEVRNGLLPTVWESTWRFIWRQFFSHFWSWNKWRGHPFAMVPPEVLLTESLEGIAPTVDFTCTRRQILRIYNM